MSTKRINNPKTHQEQVMTVDHPEWEKFCNLLEGPEGCDFKEEGGVTWKCSGGLDKSLAEAILKKHFPEVDIEKSMKYFEEHGGMCDCEILFNVEDSVNCGA